MRKTLFFLLFLPMIAYSQLQDLPIEAQSSFGIKMAINDTHAEVPNGKSMGSVFGVEYNYWIKDYRLGLSAGLNYLVVHIAREQGRTSSDIARRIKFFELPFYILYGPFKEIPIRFRAGLAYTNMLHIDDVEIQDGNYNRIMWQAGLEYVLEVPGKSVVVPTLIWRTFEVGNAGVGRLNTIELGVRLGILVE